MNDASIDSTIILAFERIRSFYAKTAKLDARKVSYRIEIRIVEFQVQSNNVTVVGYYQPLASETRLSPTRS